MTIFALNILISIALAHVTCFIIIAAIPRISRRLDTLVDNGDSRVEGIDKSVKILLDNSVVALNNQNLVLGRLSVLQLAARSRRERGLEDGLQVPAATSGHMRTHQPKQIASNGTPPQQAQTRARTVSDGEMADQPRQQEARILRTGFGRNDLVHVWSRDQTSLHKSPEDQLFMRMLSSAEGNGRRNLQEGANVPSSIQSWPESTQRIHVQPSQNEAGAAGEDNSLLSIRFYTGSTKEERRIKLARSHTE
jgi:hypothetical protein